MIAVRYESFQHGTHTCYFIALHCVDKGFIPFAEQPFPHKLDGIPVKVFNSLELTCSSESEYASMGNKITAFPPNWDKQETRCSGLTWLQVRNSSDEKGFLTCAHVAFGTDRNILFPLLDEHLQRASLSKDWEVRHANTLISTRQCIKETDKT